jgi:hypothetical protein
LDVLDMPGTDACVAAGHLDVLMAQEHLDDSEIDAQFEEVGGEAVASIYLKR